MSSIGHDRFRAERRAAATFMAKYPGRCLNCESDIEVGDILRWDEDTAVHADCDAKNPMPELQRDTCGRCFTEVSVSGECAC